MDVTVEGRGKLHSFATVLQRPPGYYEGPVPYVLGWVELEAGMRLESLIIEYQPEDLVLGRELEMVIAKLLVDEDGNEVVTYMFRPA